MAKQNRNSFQFGMIIFAIAALLSACSNNSTTSGAPSVGANLSASSALSINPTSIAVTEGSIYPFTASGGSGNYTYTISSAEGNIGSSGYYTAPSNWTGTTSVIVIDSNGNSATATVYVTPVSNVNPVTSTASITGTLTNCVGESEGYEGNTWEVNGTELRSINDANYYMESPINCTGLSVAGSIPANATIVGVSIGIFLINQSTIYDGSLLQSMNLINSGATVGTASSLNLYIPGNAASFPTFTEGGSGNTWGATLTPAIVNSASFGVSLQTVRATNRLFLGEASNVAPQVTIYYAL